MSVGVRDDDRFVRVAERIQAYRPLMSATMEKIADLLATDPTAPLELSITELAERAGTSPATVTRFCRQLGYPGYVQFRVGVATDSGRGDATRAEGRWRWELGRTLRPDDAPEDLLRALLHGHVRSLRATADVLDLGVAAAVARRIHEAPHLDIYGTGGSFAMADELRNRLYRIGVNAHAWGDVHAGLASASNLRDGAIAIAISNGGRTRETIDMLRRARVTGAHTVAITSFGNSSLARAAHDRLLASVPEQYLHPADLSAKHSQLFVLDVLFLLIAQLDFSGTAARIAASADAVASRRRAD